MELKTLNKLVITYVISYMIMWLLLIGFGIWIIIKLLSYFGVV